MELATWDEAPDEVLQELLKGPVSARLALANRTRLSGALESRLIHDPSTEVVRALELNPAISNYCLAHMPRMIAWGDNGRIYRERGLPHYFWDVMLLYLFGSGALGVPAAAVLLHVIFDGKYTSFMLPWCFIMLGVFIPLLIRRLRNFPKPSDWGAWDN